jgi:hypothetical protein
MEALELALTGFRGALGRLPHQYTQHRHGRAWD